MTTPAHPQWYCSHCEIWFASKREDNNRCIMCGETLVHSRPYSSVQSRDQVLEALEYWLRYEDTKYYFNPNKVLKKIEELKKGYEELRTQGSRDP